WVYIIFPAREFIIESHLSKSLDQDFRMEIIKSDVHLFFVSPCSIQYVYFIDSPFPISNVIIQHLILFFFISLYEVFNRFPISHIKFTSHIIRQHCNNDKHYSEDNRHFHFSINCTECRNNTLEYCQKYHYSRKE